MEFNIPIKIHCFLSMYEALRYFDKSETLIIY